MMKVHFKSLAKREKWNFSQLWEHEPLINWDMLKKYFVANTHCTDELVWNFVGQFCLAES